ncbi:MAG: hypothetical protein ABI249_07310, partial [Ornithinibacter sp.]
MSTDTFEETLRGLLHESTDAEGMAFLDLDPSEVLVRGRRAVRRRRTAWALGAAAAALTVAGLGAIAIDTAGDRTDTLPAGQRSGTTSTARVDLASIPLYESAIVNNGTGLVPIAPNDPSHVVVSVDEASRTWQVTTLDAEGQSTRSALEALPSNPGFTTWWVAGRSEGLVVGLLPAAATGVVATWAGGEPTQSNMGFEPLPGTARQVFAVRYPATETDRIFSGLLWSDGERVRDSGGALVPSAKVGTDLAFVSRTQGTFGIFGDGSTSTKQLNQSPAARVQSLMSGDRSGGSDTMATTLLLVLPAGAHDALITPT